jgi:nanoRNase/pAp phosphatase (c-di-AMP/oligoRNAs hydrolase)
MVGSILAEESDTFGLIYHMEAHSSLKVSLRAVQSMAVEVITVRFGGGGYPQKASFRILTKRGLELLEVKLNLLPPGTGPAT